ncbi:MAG: hypothetical protein QRY72_04235 [Candidatus Rhabdochlamydia sp.]
MRTLHLVNSDAEAEMEGKTPLSLLQNLNQTPLNRQLQFLPLLYRQLDDQVCTTADLTHLPDSLVSLSGPFQGETLFSWAPSLLIATWAKQQGLTYVMPDWDVVKHVNSKAFSFQQTSSLPQAELIFSEDQLMKWLVRTQGERVLKTCFGSAGKGHLLLQHASLDKIRQFAAAQFLANRPLIAEPWIKRAFDFSTQWIITPSQTITYVGSTRLYNTSKGHYKKSVVGDEAILFHANLHHLQAHQMKARHVLEKMALLGFFGHVGIDAMVGIDGLLHPIVEINARKTMGWIALEIRKNLFPSQTIAVSYTRIQENKTPLLPEQALFNGRNECFPYNLYAEILTQPEMISQN